MTEIRPEYIIGNTVFSEEDDIIIIKNLETVRDNYTQIPNIIYDTLELSESGFYGYIKRTAWEKGKCTKTARTMAKELGVNKDTITKLKAALEEKGLILICKEFYGGRTYHIISIIDVWQKNHDYYQQKKESQE